MSRIPPRIEQRIAGRADGDTRPNYHILPVTEHGITYTVSPILRSDPTGKSIVGQDFFVVATDEAGVELWRTHYFSKEFQLDLETDVQEIYPVDFFIDGENLIIKHEHYTDSSGIFSIAKKDGRITKGL